jgi:hypothetical protein
VNKSLSTLEQTLAFWYNSTLCVTDRMGCSRICTAGSVQKGPDGKIRVGCASAELPSTWYRSALAYPCSTRRAYRTVQRTGGDVLLQVCNSKPVKQPLPCTSIPLVQTRYKYKPSLYSIGSPSVPIYHIVPIPAAALFQRDDTESHLPRLRKALQDT